jgi:hypothetical protein
MSVIDSLRGSMPLPELVFLPVLLILLRLLKTCAPVRFVAPDDAAGSRTEPSVTYGLVARNTANQSPLYAALGIGRSDAGSNCKYNEDHNLLHRGPPVSRTARSIPVGFDRGNPTTYAAFPHSPDLRTDG